MRKLKNKVFWTITIILTCFLTSILVIFLYQDYRKEKDSIQMNLQRIYTNWIREINFDLKVGDDFKEELNSRRSKDDFSKKIFMDSIVYTVLLDDKDKIIEIIEHNEELEEKETITNIATQILDSKDLQEIRVGNLYFSRYAYFYQKEKFLIIMDNYFIQENLWSSLKSSILLFIGLEFIIVSIAKVVTSWIIRPVEVSFNKQKQFVADASHELKTPLAVIMASSDALERDRKEDKWLYNIKNETVRMNQLVSDLLDLARLEQGGEFKNYGVLDLSKIIEMQVLTFESLAFEQGLSLKYDVEKNITFCFDENQMRQLVSILLDNAIKHSKKKEAILICLRKEKKEIILTVTNKGKAILKEEQEKIFERFYRGDKSRNRDDNRYGLGLAIAKNIVLNHHGKISASSRDGYTTFKVIFKK